jgi:transposase, IS6 family
MQCIRCGGGRTRRDGHTRLGGQRWRCAECRRRFTARSASAFSRRGFADEAIALAVRWYVRYRLSYADLAEWLAERGLTVDRSTVYRWARRFLPLLGEAARRYRRPVGGRWRVDETSCRLRGRWAYCYRAIDRDGQVVDVYFSERRNAAAAQAFFERAMAETGVRPERVVTDKAACYPPALRALLPRTEHRSSKYLNNRLEHGHGHPKQRLRPMRGFEQLVSADAVTRGHALVQHLLEAVVEQQLGRAGLRRGPFRASVGRRIDQAKERNEGGSIAGCIPPPGGGRRRWRRTRASTDVPGVRWSGVPTRTAALLRDQRWTNAEWNERDRAGEGRNENLRRQIGRGVGGPQRRAAGDS